MRATCPLALLAACAWDPPLDPGAAAPDNVLAGEVVLAGTGDAATTWVTLFAADDLGPPYGTGSPWTFGVVGAAAFGPDGGGVRAARWSLTGVPDGAWSVFGLLDRDADFHPLVDALAGATCGDEVGAHVASVDDPTPARVPVAGGERVDDVTILVGTTLPTERPVFRLLSGAEVSRAALAGPVPPSVRLGVTEVAAAFADGLTLSLGPRCAPTVQCAGTAVCPCAPAPCGTALWVTLTDADGDGRVDPYPGEEQAAAGILDVWPRVWLATPDGPDRWVAEGYPLLADLQALAADGQDPSVLGPIGVPFPAAELRVSLVPVFRHYHPGGADGVDARGPYDRVTEPAAAPDGPWSITVVSATGQTWTLPNASSDAQRLDPDLDPSTQAAALWLGP